MGVLISILSYVTRIFTNLIALKQKATNPQYNADTDSNEAISEAVSSLNNISRDDVYSESKHALNTAIGDVVNANSAWDILKLKLLPRLPASGTLNTMTSLDITNSCKDALKTSNISSPDAGSVFDVVSNKLKFRLPDSGTLATESTIMVPAANSTANTYAKDVIGNKTDSVRDAGGVANDKSLMNYMKGLIQEMHQRYVPKVANVTDYFSYTGKGVLTGVSQIIRKPDQQDVEGYGTVSIAIDGVSLGTFNLSYIYCGTFANRMYVCEGGSLNFNHRFNTSLYITVTKPQSTEVFTTVAYTITG